MCAQALGASTLTFLHGLKKRKKRKGTVCSFVSPYSHVAFQDSADVWWDDQPKGRFTMAILFQKQNKRQHTCSTVPARGVHMGKSTVSWASKVMLLLHDFWKLTRGLLKWPQNRQENKRKGTILLHLLYRLHQVCNHSPSGENPSAWGVR